LRAFSILSCKKYTHKAELHQEQEAQDSLEVQDSLEAQLVAKEDHQDQVSTKSIDYQFVYFPNSSLVLISLNKEFKFIIELFLI
jgi:hypothetical protein